MFLQNLASYLADRCCFRIRLQESHVVSEQIFNGIDRQRISLLDGDDALLTSDRKDLCHKLFVARHREVAVVGGQVQVAGVTDFNRRQQRLRRAILNLKRIPEVRHFLLVVRLDRLHHRPVAGRAIHDHRAGLQSRLVNQQQAKQASEGGY